MALLASIAASWHVSSKLDDDTRLPDATTTNTRATGSPLRKAPTSAATVLSALPTVPSPPSWQSRVYRTDPPRDIFTAEQVAAAEPVEQSESAKVAEPSVPRLSYLGQMVDGGQLIVFVSDGKEGHAVTVGDVLLERYRVERIAPPVMTYLDVKRHQRVTLHIGAMP